MGWLDNLLGVNDPSQAASLALGTNLLSTGGPSRIPISTGQAIGNALMGARDTAVGTQNDILRRQLVQAQILKALNDLKYGNAPANVRTAMWYHNASPEEKASFMRTVRSAEVKEFNGIKYTPDPETGQWRPLTPLEQQIRDLDLGAATTSGATAREKSRWETPVTFSPETNQFMFTSQYDIARKLGAPAGPPQVAPRLPNSLSVAPPTSVPPNVPHTNPDAVGLDANNGYPSTTELDAAMRRFQPGVAPAQQPPVGPTFAQPSSALPPQAGAAVLEKAKKDAELQAQYESKLRDAYPQAKSSVEALNKTIDMGLSLIADLKKGDQSYWNTGYAANVPVRLVKGSGAFQDEQKMSTLRDKVVIETMKQLKALSATGATGFGQLSEREGSRLENNVAPLVVGLTPEERNKSLDAVEQSLKNIKDSAAQTFSLEFGRYEQGRPPTQPSGNSIDQLRQEANQAITKGKDPAAVRARFKEITGQEL